MMMTLMTCLVGMSYGQTATYDELMSKKKKGNITTYINSGGDKFNVGDTLTVGVPFGSGDFVFLYQNAGQFINLIRMYSNVDVIITKIKGSHRGVAVYTSKCSSCAFPLLIPELDKAVVNGELKTSVMSSDEVLTELKRCKDKLELGLMSQEDFNNKRDELSKFIK